MDKERHGFTSFCLWCILIVSIIFSIICLFAPETFTSIGVSPGLMLFLSCANIIFAILLINYNIWGFWGILAVYTIGFFNLLSLGYAFVYSLLSSVIPAVIFWGILHLKKNGISTWDYLTGNISQDNLQKKCPYCANIIKREAIVCQYCGRDLPAMPQLVNNTEYDLPKTNDTLISVSNTQGWPYVIRDTDLNDSLSSKPKSYRTLKEGEKVKVQTVIDRRNDLGGIWALITTEKNEEGWCLSDAISKIENN